VSRPSCPSSRVSHSRIRVRTTAPSSGPGVTITLCLAQRPVLAGRSGLVNTSRSPVTARAAVCRDAIGCTASLPRGLGSRRQAGANASSCG